MQSSESEGLASKHLPSIRTCLSAGLFYGIILSGLVFGILAFCLGGWAYLEFGDRTPTGHRIWEGVARVFVVPICAMIGATFGGLGGFAAAVLLTVYSARNLPPENNKASMEHESRT